jgi:hypothetical protein
MVFREACCRGRGFPVSCQYFTTGEGERMLENFVVYRMGTNGKHTEPATRSLASRRSPKGQGKGGEPLGVAVDGMSSTLTDGVEVQVRLDMTRAMVCDLFERAASFGRENKPELVRIRRALLEGHRK